MSRRRFLETISVEWGKALHIEYHNQRFNRTRKESLGLHEAFDLATIIASPDLKKYRCRIVYGEAIESVEYIEYQPKVINTIRVMESSVEYNYKFADRDALDLLKEIYKDSEEVLIVNDGLVTDTTIANIAFLDGHRWVTPKKPLLRGTTRQRLLDEEFLSVKDIKVDEIFHYNGVALMNAMIGFKVINPTWLGV